MGVPCCRRCDLFDHHRLRDLPSDLDVAVVEATMCKEEGSSAAEMTWYPDYLGKLFGSNARQVDLKISPGVLVRTARPDIIGSMQRPRVQTAETPLSGRTLPHPAPHRPASGGYRPGDFFWGGVGHQRKIKTLINGARFPPFTDHSLQVHFLSVLFVLSLSGWAGAK